MASADRVPANMDPIIIQLYTRIAVLETQLQSALKEKEDTERSFLNLIHIISHQNQLSIKPKDDHQSGKVHISDQNIPNLLEFGAIEPPQSLEATSLVEKPVEPTTWDQPPILDLAIRGHRTWNDDVNYVSSSGHTTDTSFNFTSQSESSSRAASMNIFPNGGEKRELKGLAPIKDIQQKPGLLNGYCVETTTYDGNVTPRNREEQASTSPDSCKAVVDSNEGDDTPRGGVQDVSANSNGGLTMPNCKWKCVRFNPYRLPLFFRFGIRYNPPDGTQPISYRVLIENVPVGLPMRSLMGKIRGGTVVSCILLNTESITGKWSALVRFRDGVGALAFKNSATRNGILFQGEPAVVKLIETPTYPLSDEERENIFFNFHTRCLRVENFTNVHGSQHLAKRLRSDLTVEHLGESPDGVLSIRFTSVRYASHAFEMFSSLAGIANHNISFTPDPCAEPIDENRLGIAPSSGLKERKEGSQKATAALDMNENGTSVGVATASKSGFARSLWAA